MVLFLTQLVLAIPLVATYTLFALGVVLIYRASRVLNLAHGVMALLPAYLVHALRQAGLPMIPAIVIGIASGALLGSGVELVFVRRLRKVSSTAQTVGTVAVFGLVVAAIAKIFGTTPLRAEPIFPDRSILFGASGISYGQIAIIVIAAALTAALFALFKFTALGLAMRGAASNRRAAALMGINPDRTTQIAWMMGGGLAAVAGILLSGVVTLDPYIFPLQALPAFVAVLLGGLESMPGALWGAAVVGLAAGVVPGLQIIPGMGGFATSIGATEAALTLLALVVMAIRGQRLVAGDVRSELT
ncbi:MAG: branched-chain amino acid ABC transporter permease [Acidimicrobiia bacterium]